MTGRILGLVLAGGASSRFGSDKARALLHGRPLIEHAIGALKPHVDAVAIGGAHHGDYPSIDDWPCPGLGPLGGLAGALRYASREAFDAVLTVPCDTPNLSGELLARLISTGGPAVLTELPVCGAWPVSLREMLERHLEAAIDRSMRKWATIAGAALVKAGEPVANINTPSDLDALAGRD